MSNVGKIITDGYCNGFCGRIYTLEGSVIEAEGEDWVVIRETTGEHHFISFQYQDGTFFDDSVFKTRRDKQELIDNWTK